MVTVLGADEETQRHWCINDQTHRHHFGVIPGTPGTLAIRVDWKKSRDAEVHEVGRFSLDLKALLERGFVREVENGVMVRFQRTQKRIEIATKRSGPALQIGNLDSEWLKPDATATRPALFVGGVYRGVLEEIETAQDQGDRETFYLQPHSQSAVALLRDEPPTTASPMRIYASLTDDLEHIHYSAEIVGWEDKRELNSERRDSVAAHLKEHQKGEVNLFLGEEKGGLVNLISIRRLQRLPSPRPVSDLIKLSDRTPLKSRPLSGGHSYVFDIGDLVEDVEANDGDVLTTELARPQSYPDGAKKTVTVNYYERNPAARRECLRIHGYRCSVCGWKMEEIYGEVGENFIHVHHLRELAEVGEEYEVDPREDLSPVCPNCHAMLHKRRPAYSIEELRAKLIQE